MKNSTIIIAIIIIVAVVIVGAYAVMNMNTAPADNKTAITANGSKVTIINNNKDVWAHWNLAIQNAPLKNGTQQTYYVQVWIKPGQNATFDLSNILGYGNAPLPQNTNLTVLGNGGLYNTTASGTSKFNTTFFGWTTNQNMPSPSQTFNNASNGMTVDPVQPVGALPSNITGNTVTVGTTNVVNGNDQLFVQLNILIGPNGVPYFGIAGTPTLCGVIGG